MADVRQTATCREWHRNLRDRRAAARIASRIERLENDHCRRREIRRWRRERTPTITARDIASSTSPAADRRSTCCSAAGTSRRKLAMSGPQSAWRRRFERWPSREKLDPRPDPGTRAFPFDAAEALDTPEAIAEYLTAALETNDRPTLPRRSARLRARVA